MLLNYCFLVSNYIEKHNVFLDCLHQNEKKKTFAAAYTSTLKGLHSFLDPFN